MNAIVKLTRTELRLVLREPLVLAFVFAFPIVTVLVIAGSFGSDSAHSFAGVLPAKWYVSSYLAVVIAAVGLVMVPVHVASYRERGVLRRLAAAGFPRWSFAVAQVAVGVILTVVASLVLLAVAAAVYGLPPLQSPVRAIVGILVGAVTFTSIGLLIGTVVPNARAAQGIGLLAFFPSFLLGGGGPPPSQMGKTVVHIADILPPGPPDQFHPPAVARIGHRDGRPGHRGRRPRRVGPVVAPSLATLTSPIPERMAGTRQ